MRAVLTHKCRAQVLHKCAAAIILDVVSQINSPIGFSKVRPHLLGVYSVIGAFTIGVLTKDVMQSMLPFDEFLTRGTNFVGLNLVYLAPLRSAVRLHLGLLVTLTNLTPSFVVP